MEKILWLLVIILCFIVALILCFVSFHFTNEKIKLKKIELYDHIDFKSKEVIIDDIVSYEFDKYKLNNPSIFIRETALTREETRDIVVAVSAKCYKKITPAIKTNMALIYNIETEDDIINIIGEKVALLVTQFIVDLNGREE